MSITGPYMNSILSTKIPLHITEVGRKTEHNLHKALSLKIANKCIEEGFVSSHEIKIINFSSGMIQSEFVVFDIVYSCSIAHPVEGQLLECIIKTITKAGIHARVMDEHGNSPVTVFIARDHNYTDNRFSRVKEGQSIVANVIGSRYELNDPYICVIATLANIIHTTARKDVPTIAHRPKSTVGVSLANILRDDEDNDDEDEFRVL